MQDPNKKPQKTTKLIRELSDLVTYCKSVAFQDFQYSSENRKQINAKGKLYIRNERVYLLISVKRLLTHQLTFCFSIEKFWEMCSFSENVARRLAQTFPEEFVNYNKSFLSRIYPAGKRLDSSNFNPQEMWDCGCQIGKNIYIVEREFVVNL